MTPLPPFGVANYRSFDYDGVFLPHIRRFNIFLGRNNCGKSNVLRFLDSIAITKRWPPTFDSVLDTREPGKGPVLLRREWTIAELVSDNPDFIARCDRENFKRIEAWIRLDQSVTCDRLLFDKPEPGQTLLGKLFQLLTNSHFFRRLSACIRAYRQTRTTPCTTRH